jgi:hypothetical protein
MQGYFRSAIALRWIGFSRRTYEMKVICTICALAFFTSVGSIAVAQTGGVAGDPLTGGSTGSSGGLVGHGLIPPDQNVLGKSLALLATGAATGSLTGTTTTTTTTSSTSVTTTTSSR